MSNESFDRKMKEELEGFSRPIQTDVWAKIQPNLPLPWYMVAWAKYAWPFYALTTTCLLFVGGYKQVQLTNQLNTTYAKISTLESLISAHSASSVTTKDTVYVEKTVFVKCSQDVYTSSARLMPISSENREEVLTSEISSVGQFKEKRRNAPRTFVGKKENTPKERGANTSNELYDNNKMNVVDNQQMGVVGDSISSLEKQNLLLVKSEEEIQEQVPEQEEEIVEDSVEASLRVAENVAPKKSFSWPKIQTRVGMTGHYSIPETFGLGPIFELFLGKNISISAGVLGKKYPEIEFENASVYNFTLGENFETKYAAFIPSNYDRLEDIELNTSVIQVPLYLNYYQPIRRNFQFMYSFGTQIDARVFQHIDFETYLNDEETYTDFTVDSRPKSWNSFSVGAGLQYQWNQVRFQVQPSFLYRFREVDYYSTGGNFQIRAGILFQLSD